MRVAKLFSVVLFILTLTACQSVLTLEEAIEKKIPFNVNEVIHKEEVKDGIIVFYTTKQKNESGPIKALAVAFLKKHKQGYENAGNNHWYDGEHEHFTKYINTFYDYDQKGKLENKIAVTFGKVINGDIKSIEVRTKDGYEEAEMFELGEDRYYFKLGNYKTIRGLGKEKDIIFRQKK